MERDTIFAILNMERIHQDKKWGGPTHDASHEVESWVTYMRVYLRRAEEAMMGIDCDKKRAMGEIRKATALGVACMEYHYEE